MVNDRYRASLLAVNHFLTQESTTFYTIQKLPNFLLEIMTLVSSANITGSDKVCIVGGRLFMYIMKSKGLTTDPWRTPSLKNGE
jgi:hypothetical protein